MQDQEQETAGHPQESQQRRASCDRPIGLVLTPIAAALPRIHVLDGQHDERLWLIV